MSEPLKIVVLRCVNCGASLDITPEMEIFACGYCATQQMIQRSAGTVSLKLIGDAIVRVQQGTDRTAAELAVRRLREDLEAAHAHRHDLFREKYRIEENRKIAVIGESEEQFDLVLIGFRFLACVAILGLLFFVLGLVISLASETSQIFAIVFSIGSIFLFGSIIWFSISKIRKRSANKKQSLEAKLAEQTPQQAVIIKATAENQRQIDSIETQIQRNLSLLQSPT